MRCLIGVLLSLLLTGCAIEPEKVENNPNDQVSVQEQEENLAGTFMLQAESGYISADNNRDAEIYIINTDNNEVYIAGKGKKYTKEDLEQLQSMTEEEIDEFIGPEENPLFKIIFLEATRDLIVLEYEEETVTFRALSNSIF